MELARSRRLRAPGGGHMHEDTRAHGNDPLWAGRVEGDAGPTRPPSSSGLPAPTRVCRDCAAQAQTDGLFCPYCGTPYARKKRFGKRVKVALAIVVVLLIAGAVTAGVLIKKHHDDQLAAEKHARAVAAQQRREAARQRDRKSTRLNSSHPSISYAVFC